MEWAWAVLPESKSSPPAPPAGAGALCAGGAVQDARSAQQVRRACPVRCPSGTLPVSPFYLLVKHCPAGLRWEPQSAVQCPCTPATGMPALLCRLAGQRQYNRACWACRACRCPCAAFACLTGGCEQPPGRARLQQRRVLASPPPPCRRLVPGIEECVVHLIPNFNLIHHAPAGRTCTRTRVVNGGKTVDILV